MKSHKKYYSSSSQNTQSPSVFGDGSVYETLRSNGSQNLHNTKRRKAQKVFQSNSSMAKSYNNLSNIDKQANADPELIGVHKSKNGYHLSVDLKAHLLNGLQRPSSSMQLHKNFSQQQLHQQTMHKQHLQKQHLQQQSLHPQQYLQPRANTRSDFYHSTSDVRGLTGGSRVSMVNLYDPNPGPLPPPIITRPVHNSSNQKVVINLEGASKAHLPVSNNSTDTYIMKSLKPSGVRKEERRVESNKENIGFDLCLFGTVNKKIEKVISTPAPPAKVVKVETEKVVERYVHQAPVEHERKSKTREVIEETEVRAQVGLPSLNIRPPKPPKKRPEKISKSMIEDLNNATYKLEEEEEEMLRRLLRGAPPNSYEKKINVERETEEIFGPLPEEEVEKLYAKEMINVDVISEMVHLELENGVADLQLKLTFNKIVPVEESRDTFKMTKVVVSKQILVDLRVTEERRKICEEVMQIQNNGVLDREYTWMLYRIFSTLADTPQTFGVSEGKVRVEKEVNEERVHDLNREMFKARGNTDKKFQILEEAFLGSEERSDFSRNSSFEKDGLSRSTSNWSYHDTSRPSMAARDKHLFNGAYTPYKHAAPRQETVESHDYFSEVDAQRSSRRINEASSNLHQPGDPGWKTQFSRWLSSEHEPRSRSSRIDVHSYLRPGGSRNYDYLVDEGLNVNTSINKTSAYKPVYSNMKTNNKREDSVSERVLNDAGLGGGQHRERMRSYERGLDRNDEDFGTTWKDISRSSRKYTRDLL